MKKGLLNTFRGLFSFLSQLIQKLIYVKILSNIGVLDYFCRYA
ncbi:hypothetical protein SAMN05660206_104250 [Sphingobacterium wenxiniae]|uniref:Uncharacterized protein n=1 Tax=Sphingobacterium wenxiniae TaxID=683125 RepID=A0A1I6SF10_9SPHI|nr:hypothetical protein SAMN05660206_104250 [Sphingobacterium wenxiniae]